MYTKLVHIDTSIFFGKNFNFSGKEFKALKKLACEDKIEIILTSITVNEVKRHIENEIEKSINFIKKTRSNARILRNLPDMPASKIFEEINLETYRDSMLDSFEKFLKDCKVLVLDIQNVDPEVIFWQFFNKKAPFGEGKKKNEFPDAFILAALDSFSRKNDNGIYLVSSDEDYKKASDESYFHLKYIPTIEAYINIATFHYELLAPLAISFVKNNINSLKGIIREQFACFNFYIVNKDGEVYNVNVLEVKIINEYLIGVDEYKANENRADFDITGNVKYSANVMYNNMEKAVYDIENKILIPPERVDERSDIIITREENIQLYVSILFNSEEPYNFQLVTVDLEIPYDDVEVSIDEYYQ
jgi:predicted nucleic acid-binding protein